MHRKIVKETQLPRHQSKILKRSSPIGPKIKSRIPLPSQSLRLILFSPSSLSLTHSLSLSASSSRPQRWRCGRRRQAQASQGSSQPSPSTSLSRLLSSPLRSPLTEIDRLVRRGGGARSDSPGPGIALLRAPETWQHACRAASPSTSSTSSMHARCADAGT